MSEAVKIVEHITEADRVWLCLEKAISRFNESKDQETLLRPRDLESNRGAAASERAITHRLAFYLESALRDANIITDAGPLVVDCEYNRHGGALKTLRAEEDLKKLLRKRDTRNGMNRTKTAFTSFQWRRTSWYTNAETIG